MENEFDVPSSSEAYNLPDIKVPDDLNGLITSKEDFQRMMFEQRIAVGKAHDEWEVYAYKNGCLIVRPDTPTAQEAREYLENLDVKKISKVRVLLTDENNLSIFETVIARTPADDTRVIITYNFIKGLLGINHLTSVTYFVILPI